MLATFWASSCDVCQTHQELNMLSHDTNTNNIICLLCFRLVLVCTSYLIVYYKRSQASSQKMDDMFVCYERITEKRTKSDSKILCILQSLIWLGLHSWCGFSVWHTYITVGKEFRWRWDLSACFLQFMIRRILPQLKEPSVFSLCQSISSSSETRGKVQKRYFCSRFYCFFCWTAALWYFWFGNK